MTVNKIMFIYDIIKGISRGKSLVRTLMNLELKNYSIGGKVLDIGGGKKPSYYSFLKKYDNMKVVNIDAKSMQIDLEKDKLPVDNGSIDYVLMFNILEHIYNHNFLAREIYRVLKQNGQVLGFVPFLVNYHPDPHDYFRYTKEALEKIFQQAGFEEIYIKRIGRGPIAVNYNNIVLSLPKIVSIIIFPIYYCLDWLIVKLRPKIVERYPLGYMFKLSKKID